MPELAPIDGEIVIDKPGKGAFHDTGLHETLQELGITHLVFMGVTTEVCVQTSMREANDRGYDCLLVEDGTESYFPEFKAATLAMIAAQGAHRRLDGAGRRVDRRTARMTPLHTLADWRQAYADGIRPADVLPALVETFEAADTAWIWRAPTPYVLAQLAALPPRARRRDAAVGRAVRGEGQHRRRRHADHRPPARRSRTRRERIARAPSSGCVAAGAILRRQDQPRPVRDRPRRHALAVRRGRATRSTRRYVSGGSSSGSAVGGGARRSCRSRSAPTPPARAACPRASTTSSA